jgi:hypothetical protein
MMLSLQEIIVLILRFVVSMDSKVILPIIYEKNKNG